METARKKLLPLQILKILRENSCEEKPITQAAIGKLLRAEGYVCDRKTISRNIGYLLASGYNIVKISGGGCFYVDSAFSEDEIMMIVDAIYSSTIIPQAEADSIIEKLSNSISHKVQYIFGGIQKHDIFKAIDRQLFFNIAKIKNAIKHNHQVSFYLSHYEDGSELCQSFLGIVANPYYIISNGGKYYLICSRARSSILTHYRIDLMSDIFVLDDTQTTPITKTIGNKNGFDPIKYASEHINSFGGRSVTAKLKLPSSDVITDVIDRFDKGALFVKEENGIFATVTANQNELVNWCLQHGEVEIVAPQKTRELVKLEIENLTKKYCSD